MSKEKPMRITINLDGQLVEQFLRRKRMERITMNATLAKRLIALELDRGENNVTAPAPVAAIAV